MAKHEPEPEAAPATTHVWPHPALAERGENLAGVGLDGADVPLALAKEWLAAGLAVDEPPALPAPAEQE